jgi:hypothetical protein
MPLTPEERARADASLMRLSVPYPGDARSFVDAATREVPWQRTFVLDQSPRKALFGERRGAKTTTFGIACVARRLSLPNSKGVYVGLTQESATRVFCDEVLDRLRRRYQLPFEIVGDNEARFENGSIIYVIGLDATKKQKERVRGIKASDVTIDEMQSFTQDIGKIILEILGPAAADTMAPILIGGTAGDAFESNFWYQLTRDNTPSTPAGTPSKAHPEWKVWRCKWSENTATDEITGRRICDNVRDYHAEQIRKHPGIERTDSWLREWEAKWVILITSLIYRFGKCNLVGHLECMEIDTGAAIPKPGEAFLASAVFILGLDLGYNDPTAFVVCAYNTAFSNKLYVIESFQQSGMLVAHVHSKIVEYEGRYEFTYKVGDSSSLQIFEDLRQTYGHNFEKADKLGKRSHQLMVNSDLQTRVVVVLPGNDELVGQLETCRWEAEALKKNQYVEDPKDPNHLSDAFLYAHHFSRSLWYEAPKPRRNMTNEDHVAKLTKSLIEKQHQEFSGEDGGYSGDIYSEG